MLSALAVDMVAPAFHKGPEYAKTLGPEVVELCEAVGYAPNLEQRLVLDDASGCSSSPPPLHRRRLRLSRARHPLPRRLGGLQGPPGPVRRPDPASLPRQDHGRGARLHDAITGVLASSLAKRAPGYTSLGFPDPRCLAR